MPGRQPVYDGCVPADLTTAAQRWLGWLLFPAPGTMRRIAGAGVIANAGIIMTGAAVRLSQSGLGCPDWPDCTARSLVAARTRGDPLVHTWIEFGNRLVTFLVMAVAVLVVIAAWRFRPAGARRRGIVWLAAAQPLGVVAQAVLGGIVVLTKLDPVWVSVHFLLSSAVVGLAVALWVRCAEGDEPARRLVRADLRVLSVALVPVVALMLAAGTVVTGTGPLAGAADTPRYHLPLAGVTQLHADIGWVLGTLAAVLAVCLQLTGAPRRARRLGWLLLGLVGLQGMIGYSQYFSGLPAGLVWVHVTGSVLIWIAALRLMFATRDRGPVGRVALGVPRGSWPSRAAAGGMNRKAEEETIAELWATTTTPRGARPVDAQQAENPRGTP